VTDEELTKLGRTAIILEGERKAKEFQEEQQRKDQEYLASLSDEERLYVLLKRKYEPGGSHNVG
jgi:hypothetical protein